MFVNPSYVRKTSVRKQHKPSKATSKNVGTRDFILHDEIPLKYINDSHDGNDDNDVVITIHGKRENLLPSLNKHLIEK